MITGCSVDVDIGDTSRRVETDTIPAEGVDRLVIETEDGMVEVRGGDVDEVEIESIFDESERGDGSADIDRYGGTVSVTGDCDAEWHGRCAVRFLIVAPSGVDVIVATDTGGDGHESSEC